MLHIPALKSHPKRIRQDAPPQVTRNTEYQPSSRRTPTSVTGLQWNPASHAEHWFLAALQKEVSGTVATLQPTPSFQQPLKKNLEFLLQIERRPDSPAATWEETRFPHLNSRGVLTPMLLFKRYPLIPIATRKEPCVSRWKSKGHWVPPQLKIRPDSSAVTQMEPWVSPQNMKGGLNSLLELEKNPEFTASNRGGLTPLSQLERKEEFHASTRDKPWLPCSNSIGTPRSMLQLEKNPEISASTRDEALFPCTNSRGIPRFPSQLKRRPDFPEATREVPWGPCHNSKVTPSFPPQLAMRWGPIPLQRLERNLECLLATQKDAWLPWGNRTGYLRSMSQLKWNPELPSTTREKQPDSSLSVRWGAIPLCWLKSNPNFPVATRKEAWLLFCNSRGYPRY